MSDQDTLKTEPDLSQEELLQIIRIFLSSEDYSEPSKAKVREKQEYTEVAALRRAASNV